MGLFDGPWTAVFATWFRIRLLLFVAICGAFVSIGLSSWQTQANGGDFTSIPGLGKDFNWQTSVCGASPYMYLSPFKFTYNLGGKSYNNPCYCPWPLGNTSFRLVVASLFVLLAIALFFESRFSKLMGSPLLFCFSLLWYSAFVIDAQSLTASTQACLQGFGKLTYFDVLKETTDFEMVCNGIDYGATCCVDLILFFLIFVIWRAWGHCPDRYNSSGPLAAQQGGDIIPAQSSKASAV